MSLPKGWTQIDQYTIRKDEWQISKAIVSGIPKYTLWRSGKMFAGPFDSAQEAADAVPAEDPTPNQGYPYQPGFSDNHTSRKAAQDIAPKASTIRQQVLVAIQGSNDGLTADEAAAHIGVDFMSVRPRLTELKEQGKIRKTARTRPTSRSGKNAAIYEAATHD